MRGRGLFGHARAPAHRAAAQLFRILWPFWFLRDHVAIASDPAPLLDGIETHPCALPPGSPWRASRRSSATRGARSVTLCPVGFAGLPFVEGDAERAALLVGAAEGLRRRAALGVWPSLRRG